MVTPTGPYMTIQLGSDVGYMHGVPCVMAKEAWSPSDVTGDPAPPCLVSSRGEAAVIQCVSFNGSGCIQQAAGFFFSLCRSAPGVHRD